MFLPFYSTVLFASVTVKNIVNSLVSNSDDVQDYLQYVTYGPCFAKIVFHPEVLHNTSFEKGGKDLRNGTIRARLSSPESC